MPTIYLGAGIELGPGVTVGASGGSTPLSSANIYYDVQSIIGGAADGTSVSALTNSGVGGATYAATNVPGRTAPTVATVGGAKVLLLNGASGNQWGYNIANSFTVTDGTLFMVAWTYAEPARVLGFGSSSGATFFGFTQLNGTAVLFRNDVDSFHMTVAGLPAIVGLRVFAVVKTGSSVVYYDNNTTPISYVPSLSGNFEYDTVGYRDAFGGQPSTGYIGDVAYFNSALSNSEVGTIITYLKSKYNIA